MQAEVLANVMRYEFHPAVSRLQIFCSEDLGAFYLDVLKDRLYNAVKTSLARRSAQTAIYHITHALLQLLAPILPFTPEEACKAFHTGRTDLPSILTDPFPTPPSQPPDPSLL